LVSMVGMLHASMASRITLTGIRSRDLRFMAFSLAENGKILLHLMLNHSCNRTAG
jgi:hypothetical protein